MNELPNVTISTSHEEPGKRTIKPHQDDKYQGQNNKYQGSERQNSPPIRPMEENLLQSSVQNYRQESKSAKGKAKSSNDVERVYKLVQNKREKKK
jgi:hypothetical protein